MTAGELHALAADLLAAMGVARHRAERTARILILSEVWGNPSHGLLRLPYYLARLAAGGCRADADLSPVADTGALVCYDGMSGLGHWQAWEAAEVARDRCRTTGLAAVVVRDSSHCGALGAYTYPLVEAGLCGLVLSNGPAVMPPAGGSRPLLSTSPIAAGIPSRPAPIVVDMATSAVARGTIAARAARDEALPEGWALDAEGAPTTDPTAALEGMLAPMGGAKGFALALVVEAMTGALSGPNLAGQVADMFDPADDARPQGIAHLVLAIDPTALDGTARFDELHRLVGEAGGRAPGAGRVAPDDLDMETELAPADATMRRLTEWAGRLGVAPARAH